MSEARDAVKAHYGRGGIAERILAKVAPDGNPEARLTVDRFYPYDQLHARGLEATADHTKPLGLGPGATVLDIGSGLGGPARFMAVTFGCAVTGIDLTPEFVEAANEFTRRCGLPGRVTFRQGDALALPFPDASFDAVTCQYVAMNIEDKATLLRQAARVLKRGGRLAFSLVLAGNGRAPDYPLPWSGDGAGSFLIDAGALRQAFADSGLSIGAWTDESEKVREFTVRMRGNNAGLEQISARTRDFSQRLGNFGEAIADGRLVPVFVLATR
jgi:SAM-dependent methyltransferase